MYLKPLFFILISFLICPWFGRPSEGSRRAGKHITNTVSATTETAPLNQKKNDDSADDPAIWIHPDDPAKSIIIGTDKKGGLATYNMKGEKLHYLAAGRINNCDLRYGFTMENGKNIDVLAASNRTSQSFSLFSISAEGKLDSIHSRNFDTEMTDEVYGLCMYHEKQSNTYYVFLNSKAGEVEQWKLLATKTGIDAEKVRSFKMIAQTEGMVADDETGMLFIGVEEAGIWKFSANPDNNNEGVFIKNSSDKNPNISFDIEGLALYDSGNGKGYLIASSQGNYSYAVFKREGENAYLGSFRIVDGTIDGVEETDGLDIVSIPMGPDYPKGMLVVQDGYNYEGRKKQAQNFKYISMEKVLHFFE